MVFGHGDDRDKRILIFVGGPADGEAFVSMTHDRGGDDDDAGDEPAERVGYRAVIEGRVSGREAVYRREGGGDRVRYRYEGAR